MTTSIKHEDLAKELGLRTVSLKAKRIPAVLLKRLPVALAVKFSLAPLEERAGRLKVAFSDPRQLLYLEQWERLVGSPIDAVYAPREEVLQALRSGAAAEGLLKDAAGEFSFSKEDQSAEEAPTEFGESDHGPVVRLIDTLIREALRRRASDLHLETDSAGTHIKFRVDGLLTPATETLDPRRQREMVSRIKVMAGLDIAENRLPQDGRFKMSVNKRQTDFRVSVLPTLYGEDVVVRVLDASALSGAGRLRLDDLGIQAGILRSLRAAVRQPHGMVLLTGPTGSGKTTTLYAAMGELDAGKEKIVTIEDPVEYHLDGVVQVPVNEKKNLTFARGLRSILRHDPDKIMVGEIRDPETAQIAVQSALTGHLVFTTVHANSACDVIGRFHHMGVNLPSFVSALNCVLAQRLLRKVCPHCKRRVRPDAAMLRASGLKASDAKGSWAEGKGCARCGNTGYLGRTAVAEYLSLTPRLRALIVERKPVAELEKAAIKEGMQTLRQAALARAKAGETSLKEINRVTFTEKTDVQN